MRVERRRTRHEPAGGGEGENWAGLNVNHGVIGQGELLGGSSGEQAGRTSGQRQKSEQEQSGLGEQAGRTSGQRQQNMHESSVEKRAAVDGLDGEVQPQGKLSIVERSSDSSNGYRTRWGAWTALVLGWAASAAAVIIRGGAVEAFLLAVLSLVIALSIIAPLLSVRGLAASRVIGLKRVKDGGQASVRIAITRLLPVPFVWLAIQDEMANESKAAGGRVEYRFIGAPLFRKAFVFDYTVVGIRRGSHQFGEVTVTVGDWLGLTAIKRKLACSGELLALPGLPGLLDNSGKPKLEGDLVNNGEAEGQQELRSSDSGEVSLGRMNELLRQPGLGADSRPYREGDSLRHVNWRAAAKGRGLHTKQHMLEQPAEQVIVIDTASNSYDGDERLFDASVGWAAQAIELAAAAGGAVRLLADTGKAQLEGEAGQKPVKEAATRLQSAALGQSLLPLTERLARLRMGNGLSLERARQELGGMKPGGTIHCFSADWRQGNGWRELAAYAAEHGCRMELYIITKHAVLSYAMREQQRWLESIGISITWLAFPEQMNQLPQTVGGGDIYA